MKREQNNYRDIGSLKELRAERKKIEWQKDIYLQKIDMNINAIKSYLSMEHIFAVVHQKVEAFERIIQTIRTVVMSFISLFRKRKNQDDPNAQQEDRQIVTEQVSEI